jgi:glycosyltransferase involved in cell wall biosynthesis
VIVNGIDVERFNGHTVQSCPSWRERWEVRPAVFLFGFLGRMMPVKGFDYLAEAVRLLSADHERLPQFQVVVVTDGAFTREQRAGIERAGLSHLFRFVGFVPEVASVLAELDAVVIPSLSEACSLLTMETLASGCPLIASRCAGIRELIEGTPATGVPPADATTLARAMRAMMANHSVFKRAALAYAPVARARFDARRVTTELSGLFDRLLSDRAVHNGQSLSNANDQPA